MSEVKLNPQLNLSGFHADVANHCLYFAALASQPGTFKGFIMLNHPKHQIVASSYYMCRYKSINYTFSFFILGLKSEEIPKSSWSPVYHPPAAGLVKLSIVISSYYI